ncbi:MAG: co-chaperone GroES [Candidatus Saccharimonas sp.]
MSVPIKPLANYVVAQVEKAPEKTASGLYLPDSAKEKSSTATIRAVGTDVKTVKVADKIIYKEYTATTVKVAGDEYLLVKAEDILATIVS